MLESDRPPAGPIHGWITLAPRLQFAKNGSTFGAQMGSRCAQYSSMAIIITANWWSLPFPNKILPKTGALFVKILKISCTDLLTNLSCFPHKKGQTNTFWNAMLPIMIQMLFCNVIWLVIIKSCFELLKVDLCMSYEGIVLGTLVFHFIQCSELCPGLA